MAARLDRVTIKQFAHEYFLRVSYVDIYGRKMGYDYERILAEIKAKFPKAKTSKRWLRMMAYELNKGSDVRMPARRRARTLAEGYAETLILQNPELSVRNVQFRVGWKFPGNAPGIGELRRLQTRLQTRLQKTPAHVRS